MIIGNMRIELEPRLSTPKWLYFAVPALSLLFAFVVGGVFLALTGHSPIGTLWLLIERGYASTKGITNTLGSATPLICTGLAAAFAFRMNLFNIGQEGQMYLGMIGSAWAGIVLAGALPGFAAVPMVLLFGALSGALWVLLPAVLRAKLGTSEIVSSLLLNYVALNLVNYFIFGSRGIFRDPSTSFPQGRLIEESARLGSFGTTRTYPTVFIAIALAVGLYWFMKRSNYGYETSVFADSPNTARYAGMSSTKLTLSVLLFSGALAGLAGSMYVVGPAGKVDPGLLQIGLGYAGIVVAALARYNFVAVVLTAILFAGLREGGASLQISSNPVPISIAVVLQGSVLLFALGGEVFRRNRLRIRRVQQVSVAS